MKSTEYRWIVFTGLMAALIDATRCIAVDPMAVTKPAPLIQQEFQERYRIREERMAALEAVHLKIFRDEVEAAKSLTVRERLIRAAEVTGEMEALAEKGNPQEGQSRYAIYPRASHVARVIAARPWLRDDPTIRQLDITFVRATADYRWPTKAEQEPLRELLSDEDSDVRVMAMEALATLYDPIDLNEIVSVARTTDSNDESPLDAPSLFFQTRYSYGQQSISPPLESWPTEDDPLVDPTFWRSLTWNQHVDRALRQLTGTDVNCANVEEWRRKNGESEESHWYWQYRLRREYEPIKWQKDQVVTWREKILAELAGLDPLLEAKVLLLNRENYDNGGSNDPGVLGTWQTRLSKDELFQILAGDRLWNDVNWADKQGYTFELDSQLAMRIMSHALTIFAREDVPQLIETLATTKLSLTGYGRDAWHVGISRLLPAAELESIDDIATRDGYLRNALQNGTASTGVVDELMRVGLSNSREFLHELFFQKSEQLSATYDAMQSSILGELARVPLTAEQRQLLWAIVTDDRFRPIWTYLRKPQKGKGHMDHSSRRAAIRSINQHAGQDFITASELKQLGEAETSQATYELILARLKAFEAAGWKSADPPPGR